MHVLNSVRATTVILSDSQVGDAKAGSTFSFVDALQIAVVFSSCSYVGGSVAKVVRAGRRTRLGHRVHNG